MDFLNYISNAILNTNILSKAKAGIGPINSQGEIQTQNISQQFVIGGIRPINDNGCMVATVTQQEKEKVKIVYDLDSSCDT